MTTKKYIILIISLIIIPALSMLACSYLPYRIKEIILKYKIILWIPFIVLMITLLFISYI